MNFSFPDEIIRKSDFISVLDELKTAAAQDDSDRALKNLSVQARALISQNQIVLGELGLPGFIEQIEQAVDEAPVFDIILPAYPHDTFLIDLVRWFRGAINPSSFIDLSVRRSIGGGMVLRSKNRMFDMSLRPKVLAAKNKLPEVLRRV